MSELSRRKFLQLSAVAGTALVTGDWVRQAIDSVHALIRMRLNRSRSELLIR